MICACATRVLTYTAGVVDEEQVAVIASKPEPVARGGFYFRIYLIRSVLERHVS
jgi:hypothetical protein